MNELKTCELCNNFQNIPFYCVECHDHLVDKAQNNKALKEMCNELLDLYKSSRFNLITINSNTPGVDFYDLKQEIKEIKAKINNM